MFNPTAKRYTKQELSKSYEINEKEKKRRYNNRILEVKHGSFTPLVFSATGGMGREAKKFYSRLAEIIAEKRQAKQHIITTWIRRKISFSLIRSIGTCLRGSRTTFGNNLENSMSNDAQISEYVASRSSQ